MSTATGPLSGGTFDVSDVTVGTIAFSNGSNAALSDDSYASAVLTLGADSHLLKASNFGFAIPSDATINGIVLEIERSGTVLSAVQDEFISLMQAGVANGNNKASASAWPTTDAYASYGSATDLWGLTWTPTKVNASGFGVAISAVTGAAAIAQIDHIRITVYWTGSNRTQSQAGNRKINAGGMGQPDFVS